MLNFFRINDPYRILAVLIIILLIRIPFFLGLVEITLPELKWLLIGEKLGNGAVLYRDLWDNTAPLSAWTYQLFYWIFGKSYKALHFISMLLVLFQSYLINNTLLVNKAFRDFSYVPALVYVILVHLVPDFYTLSPILLSTTFIILSIRNLFRRIEFKAQEENIHNAGLFMGIAALFYFPTFLLFIFILLSYAFFTGTIVRRYFLSLYGFLIPFALAWLYFFWKDAAAEFYNFYIYSWIYLPAKDFISLAAVSVMIIPIAIVLFRALINLYRARGFSNYQVRLQLCMLLMILFSTIIFLLAKERSPKQLIIFIFPVTFFLSHYFISLARNTFSEIKFFIFLGAILFVNLSFTLHWNWVSRIQEDNLLEVRNDLFTDQTFGKKIVVLGERFAVYDQSSLATPYLNWDLSTMHFENLDYYENVSAVYQNFSEDPPEIIVDTSGAMEEVFERIPELKKQYRQEGKEIYILNN